MNSVTREDIERLCAENSGLFSAFDGSSVLITGATGLIGSTLAHALLRAGEGCGSGVRVIAVVRNVERARRIFVGAPEKRLTLLQADITQPTDTDLPVDYIVHGASMTSSLAFAQTPADVIFTNVDGTRNTLELARKKSVKGFVLLSTMEVYGAPGTDEKIDESHASDLDAMAPRSSYPESKRLCESLCAAYCSQYKVPAKVVRLTQTFGPGTAYDDGRVFAQFARCAIEKRDIILRTKGETRRSYLYTADAVTAILTVLLRGEAGKAYNAANEDTYCSIYDMAKLYSDIIAGEETAVRIEEQDISKFGYAPTLRMNLDTSRLRALGWQPAYGMEEMLRRLCASMEEDRPADQA